MSTLYFVPMMLCKDDVLYLIQHGGLTPLHLAAREGHTTCVERLISTPGSEVNIGTVSWSIEYCMINVPI